MLCMNNKDWFDSIWFDRYTPGSLWVKAEFPLVLYEHRALFVRVCSRTQWHILLWCIRMCLRFWADKGHVTLVLAVKLALISKGRYQRMNQGRAVGVMHPSTLRASLSGTFLQTLPDLVTPLKGHSLSPCCCPATRSAPSERFGY